jgi:hypothetical protein
VPAKAIESEAANNKDDDNPEQQRVAQQETGGEIMGPRGAPTTCHNQHGDLQSYSFGQI